MIALIAYSIQTLLEMYYGVLRMVCHLIESCSVSQRLSTVS
jgi:hypothetical protein